MATPAPADPTPTGPKNIDIREDAVIAFAAVYLGVPFDNPEQIAEQLRITGSRIVCGPTGMIVQTSTQT